LRKNFPGAGRGIFAVFAGLFEGVFEKLGVLTWCFAGKNVVECVVNVVS
jgi:hypothetical protein